MKVNNQSNINPFFYSFKDHFVKNETVSAIVFLASAIFLTCFLIYKNYSNKINKNKLENKTNNDKKDPKKLEDKTEDLKTSENRIRRELKNDPILKDTDFSILEKIFEDTNICCAELPTYNPEESSNERPVFQKMEASIMKGKHKDIPFIAFKLECVVTAENINKLCKDKIEKYAVIIKNYYKERKSEQYAYLLYFKSNSHWEEYDYNNGVIKPFFFKSALANKNQEKNIQSFNEFIKNGKGEDLNGVLWELVK